MNSSGLAVAILVALVPVAIRAAPVPPAAKPVAQVHPLKDAKVGDFATYKMTIGIKDQFIRGSMSQTVTAKTEKEVAIETAVSINGSPCSSSCSEHKIDFTKPFDPTAQLGAPEVGTQFEKVKTGTETLEIGGKEHDAVWTSYRVTRKNGALEYEQEMKFWRTKTLPGNFVKMEVICLDGSNLATILELTETGRKK